MSALGRPPSPVLDALYPITHFFGHRTPSVTGDVQPGQQGYVKWQASYASFLDFHWLDPLWYYRKRSSAKQSGAEDSSVETQHDHPPPPSWRVRLAQATYANIKKVIHSGIGSFAILSWIALIARSGYYREYSSPIILGAFGTEAILVFAMHTSPPSQPSAIVIGNTMSALLAVTIQKGFTKYSSYKPGDVYGVNWAAPVAAELLAQTVLQLAGIVHPPGAAIAVLATTTPMVVKESWELCGHVILISLLFVAWGCIVNNVGGRRWPSTWYPPFFPQPKPTQEISKHLKERQHP